MKPNYYRPALLKTKGTKTVISTVIITQFFLIHFPDIDECDDSSLNNCHADATCINSVPGFSCSCNAGFQGNGITCIGKCQNTSVVAYSPNTMNSFFLS